MADREPETAPTSKDFRAGWAAGAEAALSDPGAATAALREMPDELAPAAPAAPGIDVERLAKAHHAFIHADHLASVGCRTGHRAFARALIAEYARLANPEKP